MNFLISDTFTDSLTKLTNKEQKAVKATVFDLQVNPSSPGLRFHKLGSIRDPNFSSVRVSRDIRIIVHRGAKSLMACYVDHHDKAYQWASRRKLETHPTTGAAQFVEIRETVEQIVRKEIAGKSVPESEFSQMDEIEVRYLKLPPSETGSEPESPPLFADVSDEELLAYGVPSDWIQEIRKVTSDDEALDVAGHLPEEASEALLKIATGDKPPIPARVSADIDPFEHPDAKRRFRVMANKDELERALDYPWEKWAIFLHPDQRHIVERDFSGPARVSGSAGTGKTIVAIHRAVYLARNHPEARVLLTTFSETLANALRIKLRRLISNEPLLAERLEVHAIDEIGKRLYEANFGQANIVGPGELATVITEASEREPTHRFTQRFLLGEWKEVVDAWQLRTWEEYRDIKRLGRKTRLPEQHREVLWSIFEDVRRELRERQLVTQAEIFSVLEESFGNRRNSPFDFAIIDEAQDVSVPQLKFLAALGGDRHNSLFFAGDLGQRIFQTPFSWKSLGVEVRGRSQTLRINYRTSHQIRMQADRLLGPEVVDVDGNVEDRSGTVSVFNGPGPEICVLESNAEESDLVGVWLADRLEEGIAPHEIGVFVRSTNQLERATDAVRQSEAEYKVLDEFVESSPSKVSICTMHLAKGLEFRAVVVMACDDEVIPLQDRIENVADDADLEEVYNTERHLLYVACTRARDRLLVTGVDPVSEFLDDLEGANP
ncbi:MAG: AAA family ATPase [Gammaproteobacteria bacterium]|nr:AAA family ATPase [Gammaproteobacteria bacterium]MYH86053.1 AAA family ATPase [Gammaproteobacteria bacterium]